MDNDSNRKENIMGSIQQHSSNADSIVEASIADLASALQSGRSSAVDLVAAYLHRIAAYDTRNTCLNSVPLINPKVFDEAAASDERRALGQARGPLDGIPFTVKDSYKVKGMTVASGSEAFENLIANEDAFTVKALRDAGAVLIGKTNMCPMAFGGMLRGVYGRAESPYNSKYLAAAFASGSSNGSGVSTGASFAAFGMGEETVSSGRSPASNNALVAYTPSRGIISIRGNWPLYPTCDVVVPHTRCMDDLAAILDVLTADDEDSVGDFWRDQPFINLRQKYQRKPKSSEIISDRYFLRGKKFAAPAMYVGQPSTGKPVHVSDAVVELWDRAKADLEALGATVEIAKDFPVMRLYEDPSSEWPQDYPAEGRLPENWNTVERGTLIAHAWDDFLRVNDDSNFATLAAADWKKIFPQLPQDDPQMMFSEVKNAVHWAKLASYAEQNTTCRERGKSSMFKIENLDRATKALEFMRKWLFEDWMTQHGYDFVVFPAAGDVGYAESDIDVELARHTWTNGVQYSNGNRCLRHLGIPSITLPMGLLRDRQMPMGLTILGKAYNDVDVLKAGYAFEQSRDRRVSPPLTPALRSDVLGDSQSQQTAAPNLVVEHFSARRRASNNEAVLTLKGTLDVHNKSSLQDSKPGLQVFVDGAEMSMKSLKIQESGDKRAQFEGQWAVPLPPTQDQRNSVIGKIARDSLMVMVQARSSPRGRPAAFLELIHQSDID